VARVSKQSAFLAAFRVTASITAAAEAVGIERQMHYRWLKEDPEYSPAFEAARDDAAQTLEDEAVRRAYHGVFEPTVYQGEFVYPRIEKEVVDQETGEVTKLVVNAETPYGMRKYSDSLLMFLLKGARPDKYRETWKGELTGPGGGPLEIVQRLEAARKRLNQNPIK
jgi:hypothetical protein